MSKVKELAQGIYFTSEQKINFIFISYFIFTYILKDSKRIVQQGQNYQDQKADQLDENRIVGYKNRDLSYLYSTTIPIAILSIIVMYNYTREIASSQQNLMGESSKYT